MSDEIRESYERVPYDTRPQPQTHPNNLSTLAWLHGIETAPASRCRVLELGCGDGGNLLAMASELPESTFVGVDLIARPQPAANVELRATSIMDVDAALGLFDFIICHGVFSWAPRDVQEKVLAISRENLAPNGIAYISYNTFPGWHFRNMLRDVVRFHARGGASAEENVERALDVIRFLADTTGGPNPHPYPMYMKIARMLLEQTISPGYFVHEYLESINEPLHFHEFAARAARHALQYVREADATSPDIDYFPPHIAAKLRGYTSDRIELEQYMDFVIDRTFRRTLLTHAERAVSPSIELQRIRALKIRRLANAAEQWRSFEDFGMPEKNVAGLFVTGQVELKRI